MPQFDIELDRAIAFERMAGYLLEHQQIFYAKYEDKMTDPVKRALGDRAQHSPPPSLPSSSLPRNSSQHLLATQP